MAIQPTQTRYSFIRKEDVEDSRLYDDGFLLLIGDPDEWIASNPADCRSVLSLELHLLNSGEEKIDGASKLHNLQRLLLFNLNKLPVHKFLASLGDLKSLTSLSLRWCRSIKSLPRSIGKLSNLTALHIHCCLSLKELPANLGDLLPKLSLLDIQFTQIKRLPWSIASISKLILLLLPGDFRLETLMTTHLNDSLVISVQNTLYDVRKTWRELKTDIHLLSTPVVTVEAPQFPSTPGYLEYKGDPTPRIQDKGLYSSLRILDLNLRRRSYKCKVIISESILDLPMLTHLYISGGCLRHLPLTLTNLTLTHLSLVDCKFICRIESSFDSLGSLSTLLSLELLQCRVLPAHIDLPVSLTRLTLQSLRRDKPLPDSFVASIRTLSNLKSLALFSYNGVDLSLLNLNLVKLKLWDCHINSLPAGLQNLEIKYFSPGCRDVLRFCLNNLISLQTLYVTCTHIQSLPSIEGLLNLQELHLKDCFNLRKFPPNMDKLVNLRSINVSSTRIKSLSHRITNLQNLQHLILPKCFAFESLSQNFKDKVTVVKDETHDFYYEHKGYYDPWYDSNEDSEFTLGSIEEENGVVLQEDEHEIINEHAPMNSLTNATQVHEGSHFSGRMDQIDNVFSSSVYHEKEIFPAENEDCVVDNHSNFHETFGHYIPNNITQQVHAHRNGLGGSHFSGRTDQNHTVVAVAPDNHSNFNQTDGHHIPNNISQVHADPNALGVSENISRGVWSTPNQPMVMLPSTVANPNSNPHETTVDGSNTYVFWNLLNHQPVVMLPSRAANPHETTFDESNEQACLNRPTDNTNLEMEWGNASGDSMNHIHNRSNELASANKQNKTQKIEITRESIEVLMSRNMRLVDAAELLDVSRSTLKRKLKEYDITWEREKKKKQHQNAKSKKQNKKIPSGGNFSGLNSEDSANLVSHEQIVEHLDGMNQVSLSDHVPSEGNVDYNTALDAMRIIAKHPSSQTQCREGGYHQQVEEPNGSSSSFVVKATYDGDTVKIQNCSLSFSIEQLKEKVGKKLGLEVGKFKLKYQDEGNDWILVSDISDLEDALGLSRSAGSNVVKLTVELIRQCNN